MVNREDQLIEEIRGYALLTVGQGMHVSVSGDHLRAVVARVDSLQQQVAHPPQPRGRRSPTPPEPAWQADLSPVLRIVAEILEGDSYADLCGVNLIDALHAWSARNATKLTPATAAAVERALAGD